jgi:glutathionylspermidine synthase
MLDGLSCGEPLSRGAFAEVKDRAVREAFKWNISHQGADRLCDFPLLLGWPLWRRLSDWAVHLAREAERAEAELLDRPLLRSILGIPVRLQWALRETARAPAFRYSRFDFHPTLEGRFAITEGNLDVAGGWNEAGAVAALFAEHSGAGACAGDPARALAEGLAARIGANRAVGIMHLTRYTDDHQIARFLDHAFTRQGLDTIYFDPTQLRSVGDRAGALVGDRVRPLDAVFRFFPAEWACRIDGAGSWLSAVAKRRTLWTNPLSTVLTQSKRFPLCWRHLRAGVPTWSQLLPDTRDPLFTRGPEWVLKPALGHEGFQVGVAGVTDPARLRALWRSARGRPWRWAAQRSFRPAPIATPHGPRFVCVGVYVVDGRAAGLYGRLSATPLIDADAQDLVVLVRP